MTWKQVTSQQCNNMYSNNTACILHIQAYLNYRPLYIAYRQTNKTCTVGNTKRSQHSNQGHVYTTIILQMISNLFQVKQNYATIHTEWEHGELYNIQIYTWHKGPAKKTIVITDKEKSRRSREKLKIIRYHCYKSVVINFISSLELWRGLASSEWLRVLCLWWRGSVVERRAGM